MKCNSPHFFQKKIADRVCINHDGYYAKKYMFLQAYLHMVCP